MSSLEKERRTCKCFHAVVIFYMCFKTGLAPAQTSPVTALVHSAHSLATVLDLEKSSHCLQQCPPPLTSSSQPKLLLPVASTFLIPIISLSFPVRQILLSRVTWKPGVTPWTQEKPECLEGEEGTTWC